MSLVSLLVTVLILALIFGLVYWVLAQIPLPPPFGMAAQVILGIICIVVLLGVLFGSINIPALRLN